MGIDELIKAIDSEIQWLKYYALADSRSKLDLSNNVSPYDQLKSIGYTKRVIPLDKRCAFLRLTSNENINSNTKLEDLIEVSDYRDNSKNIYTALEIYLILFPEARHEIYLRLN